MSEDDVQMVDQRTDDIPEDLVHKTRAFATPAVDHDAQVEAQRAELHGLQQVNSIVEGVVSSLGKAKGNMEIVSSTVNNANKLLDLWIKILSQTEHTQRLLLSPHWEGVAKDLADIEAEALAKQHEAERRAEEARERAAVREREAAMAEAKRLAAESKNPRVGRRGGAAQGTAAVSGSRVGSSTRGALVTRTTRGGLGRGSMRGTRGRGAAS